MMIHRVTTRENRVRRVFFESKRTRHNISFFLSKSQIVFLLCMAALSEISPSTAPKFEIGNVRAHALKFCTSSTKLIGHYYFCSHQFSKNNVVDVSWERQARQIHEDLHLSCNNFVLFLLSRRIYFTMYYAINSLLQLVVIINSKYSLISETHQIEYKVENPSIHWFLFCIFYTFDLTRWHHQVPFTYFFVPTR
jgi:hypothetical protein